MEELQNPYEPSEPGKPQKKPGKLVKFIYINLILSLSLLITGCGTETISSNELVMRNGVFYKVNSETGFTGKVVGKYPSGQKKEELNLKDGKPDGESISWYPGGQMKSEETFKEGERDGLSRIWFESGQKEEDWFWKDAQQKKEKFGGRTVKKFFNAP